MDEQKPQDQSGSRPNISINKYRWCVMHLWLWNVSPRNPWAGMLQYGLPVWIWRRRLTALSTVCFSTHYSTRRRNKKHANGWPANIGARYDTLVPSHGGLHSILQTLNFTVWGFFFAVLDVLYIWGRFPPITCAQILPTGMQVSLQQSVGKHFTKYNPVARISCPKCGNTPMMPPYFRSHCPTTNWELFSHYTSHQKPASFIWHPTAPIIWPVSIHIITHHGHWA